MIDHSQGESAVVATAATTLDIDLGNTRLKFRCGDFRGALPGLRRSETSRAAEWELPDIGNVQRVRISSVLQSSDNLQLAQQIQARWGCECEFAASQVHLQGVSNGYDQPAQLGVDRWLALVAGYHRAMYDNPGKPTGVLVVDLGTAATLDYVTPEGRHLGGFIIPGAATMRQSLLRNTASVRYDTDTAATALLPGTQTRDAVERGVLLAMVRLIDAELEQFDELCHHSSRLILCGGGADALMPHLKSDATLVPELVLDGLALALP